MVAFMSNYNFFFLVSGNRKRKKKIRRILDDAELGEETKRKIAIEKVFIYYFILNCAIRHPIQPT